MDHPIGYRTRSGVINHSEYMLFQKAATADQLLVFENHANVVDLVRLLSGAFFRTVCPWLHLFGDSPFRKQLLHHGTRACSPFSRLSSNVSISLSTHRNRNLMHS